MDSYVTIDVDLNTKNFDRQIDRVEDELFQIDQKLQKKKELNLSEKDVVKLEEEAEKLNNKLVSLNQQKEKWNQEKFNGINLSDIGNQTENIIKKVVKWGLALFSIRSAYNFIRGSVSTLSQSNEQIGTDIEYIRWALATAIKPIIEFIIGLAYQVLGIINSISMALFGVNLFANASAEAFQKQQEKLKGSNKQAKELQKTLAGFDEMNIVQDSGATTSGGGGGGAKPQDIPDYTDDVEKAKDKVLNFWQDIFDFWNKDWENFFGSIKGKWDSFFLGIGLTVKGLYDVISGVGEILIGLFGMIIGVLTGDFKMVKEMFGVFIDGIVNVLKGLFEIIGGLLLTAFGAIKGVLLTLLEFVYNLVIKPIINVFKGAWDTIVGGAKIAWNGIKSVFSAVASFFKSTFEGAWKAVKAVFSVGGKIFDGIKDGIVKAFVAVVNAIIKGINKIVAVPFNAINGVLNFIKEIDLPIIGQPFYGFWGYDPIYVPQIPTIKLAKGGIINYPGRGIPIGGEAGREGVIPLTDAQQMELLGEAIGKYITINASIINQMNGRVISREIQKIQNDKDFAFNR